MIGRLREDEEVSLCNNIDAQKLQFETMEFQRKFLIVFVILIVIAYSDFIFREPFNIEMHSFHKSAAGIFPKFLIPKQSFFIDCRA